MCSRLWSGARSQAFVVAGDRLVQPPQRPQRIAQVLEDLEIARAKSKGLAIRRHGLVEPSLILECIAQVVMRLGIVGHEPDGFAEARLGLAEVSLRLENHAQVIARFGKVGRQPQGCLVVLDRFRQVLPLLMNQAQEEVSLAGGRIFSRDLGERLLGPRRSPAAQESRGEPQRLAGASAGESSRGIENETAVLGWHGAAPAFRDKSPKSAGNTRAQKREGRPERLAGMVAGKPKSVKADWVLTAQAKIKRPRSNRARCPVRATWLPVAPRAGQSGLGLVHQFLMGPEWLAIGSEDFQIVRPLSWLESDSQSRAYMAVHLGDLFQPVIHATPAKQITILRVVDIVFLDAVLLVEPELPEQLIEPVPWREDLEHYLGCDAFFFPLLVGATIPLRHKNDQDVGCLANLGLAFLRIPEQVTGDEDVGSCGRASRAPP